MCPRAWFGIWSCARELNECNVSGQLGVLGGEDIEDLGFAKLDPFSFALPHG